MSLTFESQRRFGDAVFDAQRSGGGEYLIGRSQQWSLAAYLSFPIHRNQQWSLSVAGKIQVRRVQQWLLPVSSPAYLTRIQQWSLFGSTPATIQRDQEWALEVVQPVSVERVQTWTLDAFESYFLRRAQIWFLDAIASQAVYVSGQVYLLTLTGTADSLPDITLSMSSWQARVRSGTQSFLQVVVPSLTALADIESRPNADLVIEGGILLSDGAIIERAELARVNFDTLRYDQGARSASITLTGYKQTTYLPSPAPVTLTGIQLFSVSGSGQRRVRARIDFSLHPGSDVAVQGSQWTVGEILYIVGARQAYMEVTEQQA